MKAKNKKIEEGIRRSIALYYNDFIVNIEPTIEIDDSISSVILDGYA